jgi:hypothetical protein
MDVLRLSIPFEFLQNRISTSWQGIRYGLQNELLDPLAPHHMALDLIEKTQDPSAALLALATAGSRESMNELVDQLSASEPASLESDIREQWLYLALAWVYEHRTEFADPLRTVERIYADFAYPERIARFVRYMPMEGPDLGSREANERRLFDYWKEYLDEVAAREQGGAEGTA